MDVQDIHTLNTDISGCSPTSSLSSTVGHLFTFTHKNWSEPVNVRTVSDDVEEKDQQRQ